MQLETSSFTEVPACSCVVAQLWLKSGLASLKRCKSAAKASAAALLKHSCCTKGSTSQMTVAERARLILPIHQQ